MSAYSESIGSGASTWRLPALFIELTTPLASMSSIMRAASLFSRTGGEVFLQKLWGKVSLRFEQSRQLMDVFDIEDKG